MAEKCAKWFVDNKLETTYTIGAKARGLGEQIIYDKVCPVGDCNYSCKFSIVVNEDGKITDVKSDESNSCQLGN